ncbi:MAG: ribonuclease H [Desulfobacterales bacterium]|jgi:ribonuclease HI
MKLDKDQRNWKRMRFKRNKVWLAVDGQAVPIVKNGKCLIKYQLNQDYEYWVHRTSVRPLDEPQSETPAPVESSILQQDLPNSLQAPGLQKAMDPKTVSIFTDGASSGNPGPSGIGILLRCGRREKEISKFIGNTTNNVAELEAIRISLLELKRKDLPVRIFTDSRYAYGVLVLGWKAKKNQKLVRSIRHLISTFKDLKLVKVKGHEGLAGNERADVLATSAIKDKQCKKES